MRKARRRALLLAGSLVLALLVGELSVRALYPFHTPDTVREHSLPWVAAVYSAQRLEPVDREIAIDRQKAWGRKPADAASERVFYVNDQGYRGRSFSVTKPAGTIRIVVLGGSAAFDLAASRDRDWPHLIEEELLARHGRDDVEVINAALPGSTSVDSLGRLLTQVWAYEPDYVLLYHTWNDIKYFRGLSDGASLLAWTVPPRPESNPFTNYRGPLDRLASHSQLYVKLRTAWLARGGELGVDGRPRYGDLVDHYGEQGPAQFRLALETFVDLCRNLHAEPVLLTQAVLVSSDNTEEDLSRIDGRYAGLARAALMRAIRDCERIVREVASSEGVALCDLAAELSGRSELFTDHVHTTAAGSEAIAATVAGFLAAELAER